MKTINNAMEAVLPLARERSTTLFSAISKKGYHEINDAQVKRVGYFTVQGEAYFQKNAQIAIILHPNIPDSDSIRAISRHNHDYFELVYVYCGGFINEIEDIIYHQDEDHIVLLAPRAVHRVCAPHETDIVFNILLHPSLVEQTLQSQLDSNSTACQFFMDNIYLRNTYEPYMIFDCDDKIRSLLDQIILEFYHNERYYERFMSTYITLMFLEFSRMADRDAESSGQLKSHTSLSSNVVRYIRRNYSSIDLNQLSERFNYSRSHLSNLIRTECGQSFSHFVQDLRIDSACQYLANSSLAIDQIIGIVGYSDTSYFYRLFRKKTGMTPQQYRLRAYAAEQRRPEPLSP